MPNLVILGQTPRT